MQVLLYKTENALPGAPPQRDKCLFGFDATTEQKHTITRLRIGIMKSLVVLLFALLAVVSGRTLAARGGQNAAAKVPSRYMMWQQGQDKSAHTRNSGKKDVEKVPIRKRLQKLLIVDVEQLPERWMALA